MQCNEKIKDYWEGEAGVYSQGIQEELSGFQREAWKRLVLENAPQKSVMKILDVGTGPGFFPIVLGKEGHWVTGIDLAENMIAQAKENRRIHGGTAELLVMDCQKLEFPDDSFDLILCRNLTWTLEDPLKAYREWRRVLKPGGRLLIFDACWYRYLYDKDLKRKYEENEEKVFEKYSQKIHNHADPEKGSQLGNRLYLSDKIRPLWDLEYLLKLKFKKVFAEADITDKVCSPKEKELYRLTPEFMVGAEK